VNIREILLEKINATGADGFVNRDVGCGCSAKEFCLMDCPSWEGCILAKKVFIKNYCSPEKCEQAREMTCGCMDDCEGYAHASEHNETMYVPLQLPEPTVTLSVPPMLVINTISLGLIAEVVALDECKSCEYPDDVGNCSSCKIKLMQEALEKFKTSLTAWTVRVDSKGMTSSEPQEASEPSDNNETMSKFRKTALELGKLFHANKQFACQ